MASSFLLRSVRPSPPRAEYGDSWSMKAVVPGGARSEGMKAKSDLTEAWKRDETSGFDQERSASIFPSEFRVCPAR